MEKKAMKREANIIPTITAYVKIKRIYGFFEVKQTRTNTFNLSNFEPQQLDSLSSAEMTGLVHKISDQDQRIKPFDIISAPPMKSFIVIKYPHYICFIETWIIKNGIIKELKSLSLDEALVIASYSIKL